jgi:integrase
MAITSGKETTSDFIHQWLNNHVAHTTKPRTFEFYAMINRLYINPIIGQVKIQRLAPSDVQRVIGSVLDKGLSPTTAGRVYATLHRALACAMKWGVVYRNVCDVIDAPREVNPEINPPDKQTLKELLSLVMVKPHGAAIWTLAYTGLRRGEVCALRWDRLNLDKGTMSIVGAVSRQDGKLVITEPKSKNSRRMIHVGDSTVAVLRRHRAELAEYRLSVGGVYDDHGLVFASPFGRLLDPDILTETWQQVCREGGVKYRLHDLRHAHAITLIEAGTHIKTVQDRLGHSSPSLTMQVYAHVSPGMDKEAAEAYASAMSG